MAERRELYRAFGLEEPAELRKHDPSPFADDDPRLGVTDPGFAGIIDAAPATD